MDSLLLNETDDGMKELYRNEICSLEADILACDKDLKEEFFEYRNSHIDEVLVEIRAGKSDFQFSVFSFRCWRCRGGLICRRTLRFV